MYNIDGRKIYFGEMTLYHGSGGERIEPESFNDVMGRLMEPPEIRKR